MMKVKKILCTLMAVVLICGLVGCDSGIVSNTPSKNTVPVIGKVQSISTSLGESVNLIVPTVTDDKVANIIPVITVFKGENDVTSSVINGKFTPEQSGEYTIKYNAKDSEAAAAAEVTSKINVADALPVSVTPVNVTYSISSDTRTNYIVSAATINAATGLTTGKFNALDCDFFTVEVKNDEAYDITLGVGVVADKVVDVCDKTTYALIKAGKITSVRIYSDYLIKNFVKNNFTEITSINYYIDGAKISGATNSKVNLKFDSFRIAKANVKENVTFGKDKNITRDLVELADFSGASALDRIRVRLEKGADKGDYEMTLDANGLKFITKNTTATQTYYIDFMSATGGAIELVNNIKSDISEKEFLVLAFDKTENFKSDGATISLVPYSDEWGSDADGANLVCPIHGYNNMWFFGQENTVYYYIPLEDCSTGILSNVQNLYIKIGGVNNSDDGVIIKGLYIV